MRTKPVSLLLVVIVALGLVPSALAAAPRATPLEKVSSLVQPGIVYTETKWSGRVYDPEYGWVGGVESVFSSTSSCSGFFVNPDGHFVSAGHCVEEEFGREDVLVSAAEWSFENEDWEEGTTQEDVIEVALSTWKVRSADDFARHRPDREVTAAYGVDIGGLPTGKALPARVLGIRTFEKGDVSLLKVEAENVPVLELAPDADVSVGTEVVSVGYPGSVDLVTDQTFDPSFKEGSISSEKTRDGGLVRALEVSAAVAGGMSGGPTVDFRGRVIGVNSFRPMSESQAFNFVSPSAEVEALMNDKGVENELGRINTAYRQGLAAYYARDREQALAKFDEVLGLDRSHELAQEFRAKALRLPEPPPPSSAPVALIGGGIALALAALAAVALVVRRRRGRRGGSPAATPQPPQSPQPTVMAAAPAAGNGDGHLAPRPNGSGPVIALVATDGPLAGMRIPVAAEVVLGRGMVDVRLEDPRVSWRHAAVSPLGGGLAITDLQSAGGTFVNGRRIEGVVPLSDGDEIQLGDTTMRTEIRTGVSHADTIVLA
jgi:serine protease Do